MLNKLLSGKAVKIAIACIALMAVYVPFNAFVVNPPINIHEAHNPSVPVMTAPSGVVPHYASVTFTWNNSTSDPGTTRTYQLQVTLAGDPTFISPAVDMSNIAESSGLATSQLITILAASTNYICRVQCIDSNGKKSGYGTPIQFNTPSNQ